MTAASTTVPKTSRIQIVKPSQLSVMKVIIYGEPGVGKTRLLAQVQDVDAWSPALFVSVEAGTLSIAHRDIDVVEVNGDKDLSQALKYAVTSGYKSVLIDSVTLLQKVLMRRLMEMVVLNNPAMTDVEVPSQREWGIISERLQKMLHSLSAAGMNVFLSCLERTDTIQTGALGMSSKSFMRLDLPGKLPNYIAAWADIVGRLVAVESRHKGKSKNAEDGDDGTPRTLRALLIQSGQDYVAKDRTGKLGRLVQIKDEDPNDNNRGTSTMTDIYAAIFGKQ